MVDDTLPSDEELELLEPLVEDCLSLELLQELSGVALIQHTKPHGAG